jgi:adenosine deaminase
MNKKVFSETHYRNLLYKIPKAEIHLHLEGLASVDTIWKLKLKHDLELPGIARKEDLINRFQVKGLNDFIDLFINVIQNCFRSEDDIPLLINDAKDYLERNNIVYSEIFFAPSKFVRNGFSFEKMVDMLDDGSRRIEQETGRSIRFLIDVSRSFGPENAMQNLDLILEHKRDSVIGIGLGGAESQGPAEEYAEVFRRARYENLHVVAHAGEDVGPESIWRAIDDLKSERIGHGISAKHDPALMEVLADRQIPLEICPMSNIFTGKYVTSYEDHPIKPFFNKGILVTVNTDDPTIFGAELIDEYMNLLTHGVFTFPELLRIIKNTIYAGFLDESRKKAIWDEAEKIAVSTTA